MEGFRFGGVIVSNGDVGFQGRSEEDKLMSVGNNHGGLVQIGEQWYMFYHRHTSLNQYNRQGCAERVFFTEDGAIPQVTITTSGMNPGPLSGKASYPAVYCCNLTNGHMGALSSLGRTNAQADFPYLTSENGERYVTNVKEGTLIGYKYIRLSETEAIEVTYKGTGSGVLEIRTSMDGNTAAEIPIGPSCSWTQAETPTAFTEADKELYLTYHGSGELSLLTLNLK